MKENPRTPDPESGTEDRAASLEKRVEELEIKSSFLEKELEEYKEASRTFYRRLNAMEDVMQKLEKEVPGTSLPVPEATWDNENHQVRP